MNAAHDRPAKRSFGAIMKDAFLFLAAPFISLIYMAMFPFIGLAMLMKARQERRNKQSSSA